jgi:hypothetical protein
MPGKILSLNSFRFEYISVQRSPHFLFVSFLLLYISIDDDILNLMDEVNLDEFLKEAASAIDNPDKLAEYIRDKATIAIERFLVRILNSCVQTTAFHLLPNSY